MATDKSIAIEILKQLGGQRFIAMTGCYNFCCDDRTFMCHLRRNKSGAQYLKITLNSMDLYDIVFSRINRKNELVIVKELNGYYDDMLQGMFTEVTGLYTHL